MSNNRPPYPVITGVDTFVNGCKAVAAAEQATKLKGPQTAIAKLWLEKVYIKGIYRHTCLFIERRLSITFIFLDEDQIAPLLINLQIPIRNVNVEE